MEMRTPPQDLDAEKACLGSMMMAREAIDDVLGVIGRDEGGAFYLPVHVKLFDVIVTIHTETTNPIDIIVVSDELRRRDLFEFIGGHDYMIQLSESFAEWANADHYARIVRRCWQMRELIRAAAELSNAAYAAASDEPEDLCHRFASRVEKIAQPTVDTDVEDVRDILAIMPDWFKASTKTQLPTGIPGFDEKVGGAYRPCYFIVGARPSVGKSSLAMTMAIAASEANVPSLVFWLESDKMRGAARFIARMTNKSVTTLRRNTSPDDQAHACRFTAAKLQGAPIMVTDKVYKITQIDSLSRAMVRRHGVGLVVVDYLQLVEQVGKHESRQVAVAETSKTLKRLSQSQGVVVVAICQLSRLADTETPRLIHLKESGSLEQDGDVVLLMYRPDPECITSRQTKIRTVINVAKMRDGPTWEIRTRFHTYPLDFVLDTDEPDSEKKTTGPATVNPPEADRCKECGGANPIGDTGLCSYCAAKARCAEREKTWKGEKLFDTQDDIPF